MTKLGENIYCDLPARGFISPPSHDRGSIGSHSNASATDRYEDWAIFEPRAGVRARVSHVKPNLVTNRLSDKTRVNNHI